MLQQKEKKMYNFALKFERLKYLPPLFDRPCSKKLAKIQKVQCSLSGRQQAVGRDATEERRSASGVSPPH